MIDRSDERGPRGRRIWVRVFTLVGIGILVPVVVMAWGGYRSFHEVKARARDERDLRARLVAERLANVLGAEMEALEAVTGAEGVNLADANLEPERDALRRVYVRRHVLFDEVFLVAPDGRTVIRESSGGQPLDGRRLLSQALATSHPAFTDLIGRGAEARLYALVPVRNGQRELLGLIGATLDPSGPRLRTLLASAPLGEGQSVDLVDGHGVVIASTDPSRLFLEADHGQFLAGLIRDRQPAATSCHGCHDASTRKVREVLAFFPLSIVRWGVAVRQPEEAAYATMGILGRNMLLFGFGFGVMALFFAWGATVSVTRPLGALTEAAEQLTAGRLGRPMPNLGADEVGRLGKALERMRIVVKDSLERVEHANEALERRVSERTAELERANRALKDREEARAHALRQVISAQEDERRRIARGLHDEISQSLVALAMHLDTAAKAAAPDSRRPLEEAHALVVSTLEELHRVIVDLRPAVLDDLGLTSALIWYAERCLKSRGISVRCEFSGLEERLPHEIETALFRTAQEAMSNIARHAGAENVLLQCQRRDAQVTMEIEDDGQGFDPAVPRSHAADGHGFGLLGMRERVALLGGELTVDSDPGQGTRIVWRVPLPAGVAA